MINFMINFANNFEADCRDGFVSNDEAYTEKAIEGVDLNKKLNGYMTNTTGYNYNVYLTNDIYVDILSKFVRQDLDAETFLIEYIENMYNM